MLQQSQILTKRSSLQWPRIILSVTVCLGSFLLLCGSATAEESEAILRVESGDQPAQTILPKGARGIVFTRVNLTAVNRDVRITSMTIMRTGAGSDGTFSSVGIDDIGDSGDLNALHQYKVKASVTIPAGETLEIELIGNMKSSLTAHNYEQPILNLVAIDTTAKIEGVLPITGTAHNIVSGLTIGTISIKQGGLDPRSNAEIATFEKDVIFNSVRVTIGNTEDIKLKNMYWIPAGSAADEDIINPKAVILYKGKVWEFPANIYFDSDGTKKYRVKIDQKVTLERGSDAEIYLKGNIGYGVGRTIKMNPEKLSGIGATYGYEVRDTTSRTGVTFTIVHAIFRISPTSAYETFQGETRLGDMTLEVGGEVASIKSIELKTDALAPLGIKLWNELGELVSGPVNGENGAVFLLPTGTLEVPTGKTKFIVTGQTITGFTVTSMLAYGKDSNEKMRITGLKKR